MSMVLTRSPLEPIGMNGAGGRSKRRSARLSAEGPEENEQPPTKKSKVNSAHAQTVSTKERDGGAPSGAKKKRPVYDEEVDDFAFSRTKRAKASKEPTVPTSTAERSSPKKHAASTERPPAPTDDTQKVAPKKTRRALPTTPERDAAEKHTVRRSKRISNENAPSPHKPAHAKSHTNHERSPSPEAARPVTVEKKRKANANGVEEEKIMRIQLPFQDTPVIRRNKKFRKSSAEGPRRSSSGMRGRRASSLMGEGRGNALPHAEVPTAEFFKHISAELTEPRRMRCLLGWCGTRALPPKPEAPKDTSAASSLEFQALQAARVVQEELLQDLITKGILSDWFSRDDTVQPRVPLRKKPNPRNTANSAKAEELERELERLKKERAEWDELIASAEPLTSPTRKKSEPNDPLSPVRPDVLDSPQRRIFEQLQEPTTDPEAVRKRLHDVSENLEFTVDQFADGIHALSTTQQVADRLATRTLSDAATIVDEREKQRRAAIGQDADPMDALKGLAKILNGQRR